MFRLIIYLLSYNKVRARLYERRVPPEWTVQAENIVTILSLTGQ
jgi:hypothetical protein